MCRGYITKGKIYHQDIQFIGSGYQKAYSKESDVSVFKSEADERGTPFVEVDSTVCNYIEMSGDKCVKEMFSRMVKSDGESTALFPFKRLGHSFSLGADFDPVKEKKANNNVRSLLYRLKDQISQFVDKKNPTAIRKSEHYIRALDAQLEMCDQADEIIEKFS